MHTIIPLHAITQQDLERVVPGYSSPARLDVQTRSEGLEVNFSLSLKDLEAPFIKNHQYTDPAILRSYNGVAAQGFSYGVMHGESLIAFILAEPERWNSTLIIREFGVSPDRRGQGIGSELLRKAIERAKTEGLRGVVCETQTTNIPAIHLYLKHGFTIQGLDLALYGNQDIERGEVAIFLRKALI